MNVHEDYTRKVSAEGSSDRSFGLVFAAFFAIIGLFPLRHGSPVRWWALLLSPLVLTVALVKPDLLGFANKVWTRFGQLLHAVTSPVITGLVFYLAVTPTALLIRMFSKDLLGRRQDAAASTYWTERHPPGPSSDTMKNQF